MFIILASTTCCGIDFHGLFFPSCKHFLLFVISSHVTSSLPVKVLVIICFYRPLSELSSTVFPQLRIPSLHNFCSANQQYWLPFLSSVLLEPAHSGHTRCYSSADLYSGVTIFFVTLLFLRADEELSYTTFDVRQP